MKHKFPYEWTLKEAVFTKDKGKVFSCFACGGGSTMGYKLAGFDVIGCNEIDPKMAECYKANHNPKYCFVEPIQEFKNQKYLPPELYELDILDGSPPCSSFSIAGNREKDWGKEKKFREGQADQVLDTLFFDFIDLAKRLQPKVVVAENVKGMLVGSAQKYVIKILRAFDEAGYIVDYKLLNSSKMGVPQKRERVFFYAIRRDLYKQQCIDLFGTRPYLDLDFDETPILFGDVKVVGSGRTLTAPSRVGLWRDRRQGDAGLESAFKRKTGRDGHFNSKFIYDDRVANTVTAHGDDCVLFSEMRERGEMEIMRCGSYPTDYDFVDQKAKYLIGMSVPPVMMAQIATRIYEQWLVS